MFKSLHIVNFRGITDLKLDNLGKYNLIVGKNNTGKTTILESFFLSSNPGNLLNYIKVNGFRGINKIDDLSYRSLFNSMDINNNIIFEFDVLGNDEIKHYQVSTVIKRAPSLQDVSDIINGHSSSNNSPNLSEKGDLVSIPKISGLSSHIKIIRSRDSKDNENILESTFTMEYLNSGQIVIKPIGKESQKNWQEDSIKTVFISDEMRFQNILDRLDIIQFKKKMQEFIELIQTIDSNIKDFRIGGDRTIYVDYNLDVMMPLNLLGAGVLDIIGILSTIISEAYTVVLIDEIENSLHYSVLEKLWTLIFKASEKKNLQIIATSHSKECIETFYNVYSKLFPDKDEIRIIRIDKKKDKFNSSTYEKELIGTALEGDWELR